MKGAILILSSQEYVTANHQDLWKELGRYNEHPVIVVNIPADYFISRIRGKRYRIRESKNPASKVGENLYLVRPLLTVRPEVAPAFLYKLLASQLWESVKNAIPSIMDMHVNVIFYNAYWCKILKGSHTNMTLCYYLFDEVRYNANNNTINVKRYNDDEFACKNSQLILAMTSKLADARREYNDNIKVIGNGAKSFDLRKQEVTIPRSVAFVGNVRNWIDEDLLRGIIENKKDVLFAFAGPVEDNMKDYLSSLLNTYRNTAYFGTVKKEEMGCLYSMFDGIIVPYLQNEFIQATRPIKIVESVLAGTPVVTIPMDGYQSSSFIRFATNIDEFCKEIDFILEHPIDLLSKEYKDFFMDNTWENKSKRILEHFEQCR